MSDPLTDLITDIQHNGLRWLSILTLYSIYRKERRNYYLDRRDDAIFQNIKTLMEDRGKGECFVGNPNSKVNLERELLTRGRIMLSPAHFAMLFTRQKVTGKLILSRRKKKMIFTKLGKKFWLAILGAIIPVVNVQFGINLDLNTMIGMWTILGVGIAALAHVDGKQALAAANVVKVAVTADPNLTYKDLIKTVNIVHSAITEALADLQKDDGSAAFHVAADAYTNLLSVVNDFKKPKPLPELPSQQESA